MEAVENDERDARSASQPDQAPSTGASFDAMRHVLASVACPAEFAAGPAAGSPLPDIFRETAPEPPAEAAAAHAAHGGGELDTSFERALDLAEDCGAAAAEPPAEDCGPAACDTPPVEASGAPERGRVLTAKYGLLAALSWASLSDDMPAALSLDRSAVDLLSDAGNAWVECSLSTDGAAPTEEYTGWALPRAPFTAEGAGLPENLLDAANEALAQADAGAMAIEIAPTGERGVKIAIAVSSGKGVEEPRPADVQEPSETGDETDYEDDGAMPPYSQSEYEDVSVSSAALAAFRGSRFDPGDIRPPDDRTGRRIPVLPLLSVA